MRASISLFHLIVLSLSQVCNAQAPSTAPRNLQLPKGYTSLNGKLYFSVPIGNSKSAPADHLLFDEALPANQCAAIPQATDATMTDDSTRCGRFAQNLSPHRGRWG
jgi:hypothetical protein